MGFIIHINNIKMIDKKDLEFYMICPKCYQQDSLDYWQFKKYVLDDNLGAGMEGQYSCPYGCKVPMGVFALGTGVEVQRESERLLEKYLSKMNKNCLTLNM